MTRNQDIEMMSILTDAQAALKEFGEGKDDDYLTVEDFCNLIVDELNDYDIKPTDERVLAVAQWAGQCVADNGIYLETAIDEAIASSEHELIDDYGED